jgi:serine protease inhibitor
MTIVLPNGKLEVLEQRLVQNGLGSIVGACRPTEVELLLPRFRVRTSVSARLPSVRVVVDRPVVFAISDLTTGLPLFLGRVTDPSAC